ncbi:MAG: hypothetical protein KF799_16450 [Bdellovibrionales bacterium]|nr:hypothetical protein [Bdellovibrionales bacterium]
MLILRSALIAAFVYGQLLGCAMKPVENDDVAIAARVPASLPLVPTNPPPKDLYASESQPEYNFSCTEFFALLESRQPSTIEEVLQAIQKTRPKFLTRTLFSYETRMAFDGASLLYPRSIVYGGDAKMVLNFGGHNKQRGHDRLQTMCFDDKEAKFTFFDIVFPKESPIIPPPPDASTTSNPELTALNSIALTAEEKLKKYVVIQNGRGVRTCTNCHGQPARPNWDTFNTWPGFYGAADDALKNNEVFDARNYYNSFESKMWARFDSIPAKNGRYKYVSQELKRPNGDFTVQISYLNGRRIVGDLKRLGEPFQKLKYEFAQALMCTAKAERKFFSQISGDTSVGGTFGVLPSNADVTSKELFTMAYFDERQKEDRLGAVMSEFGLPNPLPRERFEDLRKYYRNLLDPTNELNLDMRLTAVDVDEVLLIRELKKVTDGLDIDIENWSMVRDGGYFHENGRGGDGKIALRLILERPFAEEFLKADAELSVAIQARQAKEAQYHAEKLNGATSKSAEELEQVSAKVCALIKRHIK